jgi:hypothetical protein
MKIVLIVAIIIAQLFLLFCNSSLPQTKPLKEIQNNSSEPSSSISTSKTPALPLVVEKPEVLNDDSIRHIDFKNFTYHWFPKWDEKYRGKGAIVLKDGEWKDKSSYRLNRAVGFEFNSVQFGDLTGDKKEEAIIVLSIQTQGNSLGNVIFVYGLDKKMPKLLWVYETGDRADGGFRFLEIEDGFLVIAQNTLDAEFQGKSIQAPACCPENYLKGKYKWRGGGFQKISESILAIPGANRN